MSSIILYGDHSFKTSACLREEGCPLVPMVLISQYIRIKNPLHKHFAGMPKFANILNEWFLCWCGWSLSESPNSGEREGGKAPRAPLAPSPPPCFYWRHLTVLCIYYLLYRRHWSMTHKGAAQSHGQNSDKSASWNIITFQVFDIFASVELHALIFFHCAVVF